MIMLKLNEFISKIVIKCPFAIILRILNIANQKRIYNIIKYN